MRAASPPVSQCAHEAGAKPTNRTSIALARAPIMRSMRDASAAQRTVGCAALGCCAAVASLAPPGAQPSSQLTVVPRKGVFAVGGLGSGHTRVAHTDRVAHAQKEVKFAFSRVNFFISD